MGMLTTSQIATFHRTGFLKIPGLFSGRELADLRAAAERVEAEGLAEAGTDHLYRSQADGSGCYFRSEKMWQRDIAFRAANRDEYTIFCPQRTL
jgi:hypothetical protein